MIAKCFGSPVFDKDDLKVLNIETFLTYVFILPIFEELAFRGIFDFRNKFIIAATGVAVVSMILMYFKTNYYLILPTSIFIFFTILLFSSKTVERLNLFVENYFFIFLIISSLLFGLLHLRNYDTINLENSLKIVPRVVGGGYFGYIAYKYNIGASYGLHLLHNAVPFGIALVYSLKM